MPRSLECTNDLILHDTQIENEIYHIAFLSSEFHTITVPLRFVLRNTCWCTVVRMRRGGTPTETGRDEVAHPQKLGETRWHTHRNWVRRGAR